MSLTYPNTTGTVPASTSEHPSLRQVFTAGMMPAEFACFLEYLEISAPCCSAGQRATIRQYLDAIDAHEAMGRPALVEQPTLFACPTFPPVMQVAA